MLEFVGFVTIAIAAMGFIYAFSSKGIEKNSAKQLRDSMGRFRNWIIPKDRIRASNRTVKNRLQDFVSVKDFGVTGDGTTDDTAAVQACLTACANAGMTAYFPAGTYNVDELAVSNGIAGIFCDGTIKGRGTASVATMVLGAAASPVIGANFVLRMDQSEGDLCAVHGYGTTNCSFTFKGFDPVKVAIQMAPDITRKLR